MKNIQFEEAFSKVRLSHEARERILAAAEERGRGLWSSRPLKIALAAALAVCVLTGTALAVSPELRDLLWGGFEPVVQRFEPDEENTQVLNGIEARLTSAMTDGFLLKVHVEFRDLTGAGRVRRPLNILHIDGRDYIPGCLTYMEIQSPLGVAGDAFEHNMGTLEPPRFLEFDETTGVLTVEITARAFNPPEGADRVAVFISEDILEVLKDSWYQLAKFGITPEDLEELSKTPKESGPTSGEPGITVGEPSETPEWFVPSDAKTMSGWSLTADIEELPTRSARVGDLEVVLSDIGLAIRGSAEEAGTVHGGAVVLTFSDGSVSDAGLLLGEQNGGVGDRAVRNIDFSAPIDAEAVVSVTVGDRTLAFDTTL